MTVEYGGLKSNLTREGWSLKGMARIGGIVAMSLLVLPLQTILVRLSSPLWWSLAGLWHRLTCRIMGLEVRVIGERHKGGSTLFAANHISWTDILVLGGHLKGASFIAKSEIQGWGFVATLCTLHKTIFIDRTRRSDSVRQRDNLSERVKLGHSLILFPEGTTTLGVSMDCFKSSLFSVAEHVAANGLTMTVQPVTISYVERNGIPLTRSQMPDIAWIGDAELFDHARQILSGGKILATIEFHPPVTLEAMPGRKALATYCENQVRAGLERSRISVLQHGPRTLRKILPSEPEPAEMKADSTAVS